MKFGWVESSENLLKLLTLNARRQPIYAADRPRDLLGSGNGPGRRRPDPRVPLPRQSRQRRNPVRGARRPRPRQTFVILCGLIDLSVGQLTGLIVVLVCDVAAG